MVSIERPARSLQCHQHLAQSSSSVDVCGIEMPAGYTHPTLNVRQEVVWVIYPKSPSWQMAHWNPDYRAHALLTVRLS